MAKSPHESSSSSFSFSRRYFHLHLKNNDNDDHEEEEHILTLHHHHPTIQRLPKSHSLSKLKSALSLPPLFKTRTNKNSLRGVVVGTLFGNRRGRVHIAFQDDPKSHPPFLVQLPTPTSVLVREMACGLVRIALECEKNKKKKGKLVEEGVWRSYRNGRKCGYASRVECGSEEWKVLSAVGPISMGAGVIPNGNGSEEEEEGEGEVMYMRARFERVVGSKDSEAYYLINPDGGAGPELSVFLLRVYTQNRKQESRSIMENAQIQRIRKSMASQSVSSTVALPMDMHNLNLPVTRNPVVDPRKNRRTRMGQGNRAIHQIHSKKTIRFHQDLLEHRAPSNLKSTSNTPQFSIQHRPIPQIAHKANKKAAITITRNPSTSSEVHSLSPSSIHIEFYPPTTRLLPTDETLDMGKIPRITSTQSINGPRRLTRKLKNGEHRIRITKMRIVKDFRIAHTPNVPASIGKNHTPITPRPTHIAPQVNRQPAQTRSIEEEMPLTWMNQLKPDTPSLNTIHQSMEQVLSRTVATSTNVRGSHATPFPSHIREETVVATKPKESTNLLHTLPLPTASKNHVSQCHLP
ncbi:protein MIZU-KUSSEI 1-like [Senna tora]|uniref:Protein MIZU-KUSSEI 1-like n=1 Tax=Senna tora TaxID=362788 RepID=A0A834SSP3_9FABA|nr:protein MIZU-KUSSEI 1-like [Senna tora]